MKQFLVEKGVKILYELDYEAILKALENLDYDGYMEFRSDFNSMAVSYGLTIDSAAYKYWERIIKKLEIDYGYTRPVSMTPGAINKRFNRKN